MDGNGLPTDVAPESHAARAYIAPMWLRVPPRIVQRARWLPLLLLRASAGALFTCTGWEATHHLVDVTAFFAELRIPWPALSAAVAGYAELVCGAHLVIGLASRLATVPLLVCMIVAIVTAKAAKIHGLRDLLMQVEFAYALLLVALPVLGPGQVSLDALVVRRMRTANGGRSS